LRSSSSRFARITRIACAVVARPMISAGTGMCPSMSANFAQLHGASAYSGENSPPMFASSIVKPKYSTSSAIRNPGTATPMKLMNVNR
jgi:hypothetical protein